MNGCWDEFWLKERLQNFPSFSPIQNSPTAACLEKINRKKNRLEHFGLFVDQQGVAGVADSQRLRRTGKFHLIVTATITEDAPAVPEIINYWHQSF